MSEKKNRFRMIKPFKPIAIDRSKDNDANFSFIAGYTSGGVPYGLTWDEYDPNLDDQNKDFKLGLNLTRSV
jgi:hypothetical protein